MKTTAALKQVNDNVDWVSLRRELICDYAGRCMFHRLGEGYGRDGIASVMEQAVRLADAVLTHLKGEADGGS